jgi:N-methylhydantoinase A
MATRVAVDIGGTFTDLVCFDVEHGGIRLGKGLSTPDAFERGVTELLSETDASAIETFVHGTTVVINVIAERKGASTALLTTRGMRDILDIQRGNRPDLFNLKYRKPKSFIPRHLRFEVAERTDFKGVILTPLDEDSLRAAMREASDAGVSAIAVCFLHSYANPENEQRAYELIRSEWPEVEVTVSSEITRQWREYPRMCTASLDAYVKPMARRYLQALGGQLDQLGITSDQRYLMQSGGGVTTFGRGARTPIHMVESGPVGAVIGSAAIAEQLGEGRIISLDIGGTTAKASLIDSDDGRLELPITDEYYIERTPREAGYPVQIPCVDIVEIGAGGGSIAWLDSAGALHVGPRSAGADPGPASYGRGGREATLTDANLIAGRIDPDHFLGKQIQLHTELARAALEPIAAKLSVSIEELALGVIRLANNNMVQLLRLVSVRRGHDPREFALVASGGNGPIHGPALARELQIPRVVIPPFPGHFSAWGMLVTDLRQEVSQTLVAPLMSLDEQTWETTWGGLGVRLRQAIDSQVRAEQVAYSRALDMRYAGQEHTVRVPLPDGRFDAAARAEIHRRFEQRHEQLYAFRQESPSEVITLHLTGVLAIERPSTSVRSTSRVGAEATAHSTRSVDFDEFGRLETHVYDRDQLAPGQLVAGPVAIEELGSTTVVFPDQRLTVSETGSLIVELEVTS